MGAERLGHHRRLWKLAGIEETDWVQRRTLQIGTSSKAPVWLNELDGTVYISVGSRQQKDYLNGISAAARAVSARPTPLKVVWAHGKNEHPSCARSALRT